MNKLTDKLIVLILCMACYFQYNNAFYDVVPVLFVIAASALITYWDRDNLTTIIYLAFCVFCILYPVLLFFLPLFCYDIILTKWRYAGLVAIIPAVTGFSGLPVFLFVFILLFIALAGVMRLRTASLAKLRNDYLKLRDTTKEFSLQLENKNKELLDKQDYEINLATLNERNRIARDIHDSIGHLLSNSILQTGALMAVNKDETLRGMLETLKSTLTQGMDSIRQSIHDLHDESIDLFTEVKALTDHFNFCQVSLEYTIDGNPDRKIKYALLAIAKEALSNVMRHSNATAVRVALREHPALYQLLVVDNGTKTKPDGEGIGLKNIEQRVQSLGGILTISRENGFTLFVSIPKEK